AQMRGGRRAITIMMDFDDIEVVVIGSDFPPIIPGTREVGSRLCSHKGIAPEEPARGRLDAAGLTFAGIKEPISPAQQIRNLAMVAFYPGTEGPDRPQGAPDARRFARPPGGKFLPVRPTATMHRRTRCKQDGDNGDQMRLSGTKHRGSLL